MIKYWKWAAIIFTVTGVSAMDLHQELKVVDTVSGHSLRAIQVAYASFSKRNLNLDEYKITVIELGSSVIVLFENKEPLPGQRGSRAANSSYEVELRKGTLELVRENFSR
jgi:hypothetical protein